MSGNTAGTAGTVRKPRFVPRLAGALAALMVIAVAGSSWYYSDQIVRPTPRAPLESRLPVVAIDESTITIAGSHRLGEGQAWFIEWASGFGVARDVVARDGAAVRRRFQVLAGRLGAGATVEVSAYPFRGDPRTVAGLPFDEISVPGPLGDLPAWWVPGRRTTWVLFVPGMAASRGEALRALPLVAALGFPSLAISYRNAPGAPRSADGLYHLGADEWEDLEAAVRYAGQHGARRVVLYGYSMGGAVVAGFLRRSPLASLVIGVILDAPVLDWDAAVRLAARRRHVPSFLTPLAEAVVSLRTGFRWDGPQGKVRGGQFRTPVLLFHGRADPTVPIAPSESLAADSAERVTFVEVPKAGHVQSWNFDPPRYQATLQEWLERVAPDSS